MQEILTMKRKRVELPTLEEIERALEELKAERMRLLAIRRLVVKLEPGEEVGDEEDGQEE